MPQWSSPWPCQASVFLYISPSDSLPALINNSKSSLGYPWFLGTQTFSKSLSCSKIESTFVMTPHGFKRLILQGGGFKFWGNICRIVPTYINIRKRWQVWDEVFGLRLSRSLKLKLHSALSKHFATRRKYVINLLPSVPVGNPGEAVNILSLEPRSCNAEMVPPAEWQ